MTFALRLATKTHDPIRGNSGALVASFHRGGMRTMREILAACGLLWEQETRPGFTWIPDFPSESDFTSSLKGRRRFNAKGYSAAYRAAAGWRAPDGLIPGFKLESNDGWILHPAECGLILGALKASNAWKEARAGHNGGMVLDIERALASGCGEGSFGLEVT